MFDRSTTRAAPLFSLELSHTKHSTTCLFVPTGIYKQGEVVCWVYRDLLDINKTAHVNVSKVEPVNINKTGHPSCPRSLPVRCTCRQSLGEISRFPIKTIECYVFFIKRTMSSTVPPTFLPGLKILRGSKMFLISAKISIMRGENMRRRYGVRIIPSLCSPVIEPLYFVTSSYTFGVSSRMIL